MCTQLNRGAKNGKGRKPGSEREERHFQLEGQRRLIDIMTIEWGDGIRLYG